MGNEDDQPAMKQIKPELLYHYTTQDGLLGIIESQEFWATHIRFLNDTEEFEAGIKTAMGLLKQSFSVSGEDGRKVVDHFEKTLRSSLREQPVYCVSLTGPLKKDELLFASIDDPGDRLNMWRSYSRRGITYSIGISQEGWATNIEDLDLQECSYLRETKEEYLTDILNSFGDLVDKCYAEGKNKIGRGIPHQQAMDEMRKELDPEFSKILPDLKSQMAACKHESFWEEREWRLTVAPPPNHESLFHSPGRFGITPRLRVQLHGPDGHLPIKRIVVGPCSHMSAAVESAKDLLKRNGYLLVEVAPSQIPYRDW